MSDYVKEKAIRMPIPDEFEDMDLFEIEESIKNKIGKYLYDDMFSDTPKVNKFNIGCTECGYYLDFVTDYEYGCDDIEFEYSFPISEDDYYEFFPLFDNLFDLLKLSSNNLSNVLHKVAFCYYNGCDTPDCYEINIPTWESL